MAVKRLVAVDWSGDRSVAGQRRKIWAGVWTNGVVHLESGRTRDEWCERLIQMSHETPAMVVGIDCCFSFPAWFVAEHGCVTVFDFWRAVAAGKGEAWLHRECADGHFWGIKGSARTGKRPADFSGDGLRRMMRTTDWENKIAVRIEGGDADRAAPGVRDSMRGITPKSPFQIGGSGSVGTGSLRAMPVLERLRQAGYRVWPFDAVRLEGTRPAPLLVEMYTRLLTGSVAKSNETARRAYLLQKKNSDPAYAKLGRAAMASAYASEDAFDAMVCCVEMAKRRSEFTELRATRDPVLRLEGITWRPGV